MKKRKHNQRKKKLEKSKKYLDRTTNRLHRRRKLGTLVEKYTE